MWMHCFSLIAGVPTRPSPAPSTPTAASRAPSIQADDGPETVVAFWRQAGPDSWFAKDPDFDRRFRERFASLHDRAVRGELAGWLRSPEGSLALCLLLDQYPRNAFRGTPKMYATDELAREVARAALQAGHDTRFEPELAVFLYLPFAHSEQIQDQALSVELCRKLGETYLSRAQGHHDIVRRFGRFPHRNQILGRPTSAEEQRFLDEGGFSG